MLLLMQQMNSVKPFYPMLVKTPLFSDIREEDMTQLLYCLRCHTKEFDAGQFIFFSEEKYDNFGVVLEGRVQVITEDLFGNRSITAKLPPGEIFGQIATTEEARYAPASVVADTDCLVMFLNFSRLVAPCTRACAFHSTVIENMMNVLAKRNLLMNQKLAILSQRTMRDKLLAFLLLQYKQVETRTFTIPFNRDELADFLCVNRSALSREIAKMIDEGIIESHRSNFTLTDETLL